MMFYEKDKQELGGDKKKIKTESPLQRRSGNGGRFWVVDEHVMKAKGRLDAINPPLLL